MVGACGRNLRVLKEQIGGAYYNCESVHSLDVLRSRFGDTNMKQTILGVCTFLLLGATSSFAQTPKTPPSPPANGTSNGARQTMATREPAWALAATP